MSITPNEKLAKWGKEDKAERWRQLWNDPLLQEGIELIVALATQSRKPQDIYGHALENARRDGVFSVRTLIEQLGSFSPKAPALPVLREWEDNPPTAE